MCHNLSGRQAGTQGHMQTKKQLNEVADSNDSKISLNCKLLRRSFYVKSSKSERTKYEDVDRKTERQVRKTFIKEISISF